MLGNNVMPALIDAVRAGATEQEVCDLYRDVFHTYTIPARSSAHQRPAE